MRGRGQSSQSGQAVAEYAALLVLVALLFAAMFGLGLAGRITAWAEGAVGLVTDQSRHGASLGGPGQGSGGRGGSGGGQGGQGGSGQGGRGGSGQSGSGQSGSGQGGRGGSAQSGSGQGGRGGSAQSGPGGPGRQHDHIPCDTASEAGLCLMAAGAPNTIHETVRDRAHERYQDAARAYADSDAPSGSPEYERLKSNLDESLTDLRRSRSITDNRLLRGASRLRQLINPRPKDVAPAIQRLRDTVSHHDFGATPPRVGTTEPPATGAAQRVLSQLGKFGKGLGVAGVALSAYDNIHRDGVGKGVTKTVAGAAGAYGAGTLITAGCAALGIATAGVGAVACAGAVLVGGYFGGKYASQFGGWAYDHAGAAASAVNDHVFKPVAQSVSGAVNGFVSGARDAAHGFGRALSALRPGFL